MVRMNDYERCLVAAIKQDNKLFDTLGFTLENFTDPICRGIYRAIAAIIERGGVADDNAIYHELGGANSGISFADIAELPSMAVHNVSYYVGIVREAARRRQLHKVAQEIEQGLKDKDETAAIIDILERGLMALSNGKAHEVEWIKDVLMPAVAEFEEQVKLKGEPPGVSTGYGDLDALTNGFQSGELTVVAARPGIGKTALLISLMVNMSVHQDVISGFFSAEMGKVLIAQRFLANVGRFNLSGIRSGRLSKSDYTRLLDAANRLYKNQVLVNDTPNVRLQDIRSQTRTMKRRGARIVFVDYLTLIQHGDSRTPRHERVGEVSKGLKHLARELEIPVVVASQLNRLAEGKEPNLSELRQSGEIEEDADVIMFIDRKRDAADARLIVAKNRNGACGVLDLRFTATCARFDMVVRDLVREKEVR